MTHTITCQYSGLQFEATNKRAKNHPVVSDFLDGARKHRVRYAYGAAQEILKQAREIGFETANDLENYLAAEFSEWEKDAFAESDERRAATKRRAEVRSLLKRYGYRWHKAGVEDSQFDTQWELFAPDGRIVSQGQALDEIEASRLT